MEVVKIGKATQVDSVVKALEDLLDYAKAGKLRAIIGVFPMEGAESVTVMRGEINCIEGIGNCYRMIHALNKSMDRNTYTTDELPKGESDE